MLRRYMHNRERHFAMLNDDRIVHPFGWGAEFLSEHVNGDDPRLIVERVSAEAVEHSDQFFSPPASIDYHIERAGSVSDPDEITWQSGVSAPEAANNTVYVHHFAAGDKKTAIVVLPHWNAREGTYFKLCRIFNRFGISGLRLTLPYHERRMPEGMTRADHLVSPNVGRTLSAIRQAVIDTRSAIRWLKQQGYERIGLVGTSIGSCVGFLAFTHDPDVSAVVFNHVSGYFADVVWNGLSTYHVREGIGDKLTLDELRRLWLPISPMTFMPRLASQPPRPQRYIYTLYDLSFPVDLSKKVMAELKETGVEHSVVTIPCGHYTLGELPWVYYDAWKIIAFLRKHLR